MLGHQTMWIKKGVKLLEETLGDGPLVRRQAMYVLAIRIILNKGDVIFAADTVGIAPYLAYREKGIPGVIPENAKIIAELKVLRVCE